jgi:hypothetical protein
LQGLLALSPWLLQALWRQEEQALLPKGTPVLLEPGLLKSRVSFSFV